MTHHTSSFTSSRGFNLIEAAIVLGVIGLVIGGIWAAAGAIHRSMLSTEIHKETGQLIQLLKSDFHRAPLASGNIENISTYIAERGFTTNNFSYGGYRYGSGNASLVGEIQLGISYYGENVVTACLAVVSAITSHFKSCSGTMTAPNVSSLTQDIVYMTGPCNKMNCMHTTYDLDVNNVPYFSFSLYFLP